MGLFVPEVPPAETRRHTHVPAVHVAQAVAHAVRAVVRYAVWEPRQHAVKAALSTRVLHEEAAVVTHAEVLPQALRLLLLREHTHRSVRHHRLTNVPDRVLPIHEAAVAVAVVETAEAIRAAEVQVQAAVAAEDKKKNYTLKDRKYEKYL